MDALIAWSLFTALAALIGISGYFLSVKADQIADKTGLGRNVVGMVMLATITSLPELMTGISSVRFVQEPNLAIGDILGSCVFNMSLIFVMDLLYRKQSVYTCGTQGHILTATLGTVLIGITGMSLVLTQYESMPSVGNLSLFSLIVPLIYLAAMKVNWDYERSRKQDKEENKEEKTQGLPRDILLFSLNSLVIVAAGSALPFVAERIMELMGWGSAFMGTIFIAMTTSLPEIAVTLSAIRINAIEMALSNIFGSNLFNVVILAIDDFFYEKGPLFVAADKTHVLTAFTCLLMSAVAMVGLIRPPQKRVLKTTSVLSIVLLFLFILNSVLIYRG